MAFVVTVVASNPARAGDAGSEDGDEDLEEEELDDDERPKRRAAGDDAARKTLVRVEVDGTSDVRLFMVTDAAVAYGSRGHSAVAIGWRPICVAPCSRRLDLSTGNKFFVGGDDTTASRPFDLFDYAEKDEVTVTVVPGSLAKTRAGTWMLLGGIFGTVVGGVCLATGALLAVAGGSPTYTTPIIAISAPVLAAGVGLTVGSAFVRKKGRTTVTIE